MPRLRRAQDEVQGSGVTTMPIRLGIPDIQRASLVLGRAFHDDPLLSHLLPDPAKRASLSPKRFSCILRYGEVRATSSEMEGVAVWLPPQSAHASVFKMVRVGAFSLPSPKGQEKGQNGAAVKKSSPQSLCYQRL